MQKIEPNKSHRFILPTSMIIYLCWFLVIVMSYDDDDAFYMLSVTSCI